MTEVENITQIDIVESLVEQTFDKTTSMEDAGDAMLKFQDQPLCETSQIDHFNYENVVDLKNTNNISIIGR